MYMLTRYLYLQPVGWVAPVLSSVEPVSLCILCSSPATSVRAARASTFWANRDDAGCFTTSAAFTAWKQGRKADSADGCQSCRASSDQQTAADRKLQISSPAAVVPWTARSSSFLPSYLNSRRPHAHASGTVNGRRARCNLPPSVERAGPQRAAQLTPASYYLTTPAQAIY